MECFVGGHLPLAIVAILTLMFYMMSTIFLVAVVMKKIKVNMIFSLFVNAFLLLCIHIYRVYTFPCELCITSSLLLIPRVV